MSKKQTLFQQALSHLVAVINDRVHDPKMSPAELAGRNFLNEIRKRRVWEAELERMLAEAEAHRGAVDEQIAALRAAVSAGVLDVEPPKEPEIHREVTET